MMGVLELRESENSVDSRRKCGNSRSYNLYRIDSSAAVIFTVVILIN